MKHVLCPVDLSDLSKHALEFAAALSRAHAARLEVLYVAEVFPGGRTLTDAGGDLDRFLHGVSLPELVECEVMCGDAKREILRAVEGSMFDCVVMGTHGRGGFERFVIGSVTERVLRKAACPVFAVPPADRAIAATGTFRSIVCAVDFAPASLRGLGYAESLIDTGGRLSLIHSIGWPFGIDPAPMPPEMEALKASLESDARDRLRRLTMGRRTDIVIDAAVADGPPYSEILKRAEDVSADLIVAGLHSHATSELALLGSTTRRVLHDAPCPVLTMRA